MLFWEKVLVGGWQGKCKDVKGEGWGPSRGRRVQAGNEHLVQRTGLLGEGGRHDGPPGVVKQMVIMVWAQGFL